MKPVRLAIFMALGFSAIALAAPKITFKNSYQRYLSGHDLNRLLLQKFPSAKWSERQMECGVLGDAIRGPLGDPNPATGELLYAAPSSAFVRWYSKCLSRLIPEDMEAHLTAPGGLAPILGETALLALQGTAAQGASHKPKEFKVGEIPPRALEAIARHLVHRLIGPGILAEEAELVAKLVVAVPPDRSLWDFVRTVSHYIALEDGFLTY